MAAYDITALSTALEFDTTNADGKSIYKLPTSDRVILAWYQSTSILYVQCADVNPSTGELTIIGSPVDLEPATASTKSMVSVVVIDDSNAAVFWAGSGDDGYARLISIDGSGNCTTNGAGTEYDAVNGTFMSAILWDSTHILNTWSGSGGDGFACIFDFNTGTGAIAKVGTQHEFDTNNALYQIPIKLNSTKCLQLYRRDADDLWGVVMNIDASTYAVTNAGSNALLVSATQLDGVSGCFIEDNGSTIKVASIIKDGNATFVSSHSVDTSTWAVTTQNTSGNLGGSSAAGTQAISIAKVDDDTLIAFFRGATLTGVAMTLAYTTGSGIGSTIDSITIDATNFNQATPTPALMGDNWFIVGWTGAGSDGFVQAFEVELPTPGGVRPQFLGFSSL